MKNLLKDYINSETSPIYRNSILPFYNVIKIESYSFQEYPSFAVVNQEYKPNYSQSIKVRFYGDRYDKKGFKINLTEYSMYDLFIDSKDFYEWVSNRRNLLIDSLLVI